MARARNPHKQWHRGNRIGWLRAAATALRPCAVEQTLAVREPQDVA